MSYIGVELETGARLDGMKPDPSFKPRSRY